MMPTKPFSAKAAAFAVFAVLVVASIAPARASDKSLDALTRKVTSTMSRSLANAVRDHNQNYERRVVLEEVSSSGEGDKKDGDKKEGDKMGDRDSTGYPEGPDDRDSGYPSQEGGQGRPMSGKPFKMQKDMVCKSMMAGIVCESYDAKDACVKDKKCVFREDSGHCETSEDMDMELAFGEAQQRFEKVQMSASTACAPKSSDETACAQDKSCTVMKTKEGNPYCGMAPMSKDAVKKLFPEDAIFGELAAEMFHCGALTQGEGAEAKCNATKACEWDAEENECRVDESFGERFFKGQVSTCAKAASASAPSTCSVFKERVQCALQDEKSCTKTCTWDKEEGKCDVIGGEAAFQKMLMPYMEEIFKVSEECGNLEDQAKCVASPKCNYDANSTECNPTDLSIAEAMTKTSNDPALTAYLTAAKQAACSTANTSAACKAKGADKCRFDKEGQICETSTRFAGGLMACACSNFGVECKGEKPSAADLTAKKVELEKRKKELEDKKAELAKQAEAAKKKQADAKVAKKKRDEELAAKKAAQDEKKKAFDAKKAAADEKRAAANAKKKAADEKKEAMLDNIKDPKKKAKAKLAAEAAIAGAKIKKFKVEKLEAENATAACTSMCTKMKVNCTTVVCEATPVVVDRRHLLASDFKVDVEVNTAEVDVAAAETSLKAEGITPTTEEIEPQAALDEVGADSTEFKDVAATAAAAEKEAGTAEDEKEAAEKEAKVADDEVAAAETAATEAATAVTDADEEVADTEAEVAETTTALAAADKEITATSKLVMSVTPSPPPSPPSPPPTPPPVLLTGGAGVAAQITSALVAAIVVLAALA